jgi:hypothetical protein
MMHTRGQMRMFRRRALTHVYGSGSPDVRRGELSRRASGVFVDREDNDARRGKHRLKSGVLFQSQYISWRL